MACSSPYATFRADAWMQQSLIRPRKVLSDLPPSEPPRLASCNSRSLRSAAAVQGELFLFPVIVSC
jgi:hypothetical protein